MYEEEEKKKGFGSKYLWLILLFFSLIIFVGIPLVSYSIFGPVSKEGGNDPTSSPTPPITTDSILFTYSDVNARGNGILIEDAIPVPDNQGKIAMGSNYYFDFNITATTGKSKLHYQILAVKGEESTLKENDTKIYLTNMQGAVEVPIENCFKDGSVKTYNQYKTTDNSLLKGNVIYEKDLASNLKNYTDSYRLRMWVREDATDYLDKQFSVKIDVYAETK